MLKIENENREIEEKKIEIKTEEDFIEEVLEIKQTNVILLDCLEIEAKEKIIIVEEIKYLKETKKTCIIQIGKQ